MVTDRDMWAEAHFGKAKLGDKRRTQRLVRLARQFAAVPRRYDNRREKYMPAADASELEV